MQCSTAWSKIEQGSKAYLNVSHRGLTQETMYVYIVHLHIDSSSLPVEAFSELEEDALRSGRTSPLEENSTSPSVSMSGGCTGSLPSASS